MKIMAFNGSPRKNWNTARLLAAALEGAEEKGAEVKLYHLYDYDFKGCRSCFACKRIGSPSYGKCALKDDLTPILAEIKEADGLILGTPIYFGAATGEFRSALERLLFPNYAYDLEKTSLWGKAMPTAVIYTMGMKTTDAYRESFQITATMLNKVFALQPEVYYHTDAYQFDDYDKYHVPAFNKEAKLAKYRHFDEELANARAIGARIAEKAKEWAK